MNSAELQKQIQGILDDLSPVDEGEEYLGVFTASDRVTWAEARNKFFNKGLNKDSLDIIEKAAFVLVLDEDSYGYDPENDLELSRHAVIQNLEFYLETKTFYFQFFKFQRGYPLGKKQKKECTLLAGFLGFLKESQVI